MTESAEKPLSVFLLLGPSLIACFLFLWPVTHSDLSKREAREGIPVVNMDRGGNLWLPKINDQRYRTKPPLFYWAGLAISRAAGKVNEITLRMPSVIAGTIMVFATTLLGFRLFSLTAGCMAGVILATSWRFAYLGSHARIDMLFALFITLGFLTLWSMLQSRDAEAGRRCSWLAAVFLGLALLTKGPLGWIFPLLALFVYRRAGGTGTIVWSPLFWVPLAMACLWLAAAWVDGGKEFQTMIYQETIGRITGTGSIQLHKKPFYYYIPRIFGDLAPWSLLLPVVLWNGFKTHRRQDQWLFPAVAWVTLFVFLSLFSGKRGDYLLPLYPMAALLIAHYFTDRMKTDIPLSKGMTFPVGLLAALFGLLALACLVFAAIPAFDPDTHLPFLNSRDRWMAKLLLENHSPSLPVLAVAATIMLAFVFWLIAAMKKRSLTNVWGGVAGMASLILLFVHGPAAAVVNQYTSYKSFASEVNRLVGNRTLFHYGEAREDLLYYLDRPVLEVSADDSIHKLRAFPGSFILAKGSQSNNLLDRDPGLKTILETARAFKPYQLITMHDRPKRITSLKLMPR